MYTVVTKNIHHISGIGFFWVVEVGLGVEMVVVVVVGVEESDDNRRIRVSELPRIDKYVYMLLRSK